MFQTHPDDCVHMTINPGHGMLFFLCLQQEQLLGETGGALAEVKLEMAIPGPLHRIPRTSTAKFLGDYCMTNCYRNCVQGKSTEKPFFNTAKQVACYFPVQFLSYPPYKIYKSIIKRGNWRPGAGKIIKGWVKQQSNRHLGMV